MYQFCHSVLNAENGRKQLYKSPKRKPKESMSLKGSSQFDASAYYKKLTILCNGSFT